MVDFVKRAQRTGDIGVDEEVLAACNVTPSPFAVANAGMTGGVIAGGMVGAALGAAWDGRRRKQDDVEQADKQLPELAGRPPLDPPVPTNGALLGVTTQRVVMWGISPMGKPREVLLAVPLAEIDEVWWEEADAKWLGGRPASLVLWIGASSGVLSCAGISMGPAAKHVRGIVAALESRLPGKVSAWVS